jgi:hypothetical protein
MTLSLLLLATTLSFVSYSLYDTVTLRCLRQHTLSVPFRISEERLLGKSESTSSPLEDDQLTENDSSRFISYLVKTSPFRFISRLHLFFQNNLSFPILTPLSCRELSILATAPFTILRSNEGDELCRPKESEEESGFPVLAIPLSQSSVL